jgi:hypothetical protein
MHGNAGMNTSQQEAGPQGNFSMAALRAAMEAMPKPRPATIVTGPHFLPGAAWLVREGDHLYAFIHDGDLDSLPKRAGDAMFMTGIPVKTMADPEMREVFTRALDRLAQKVDARHGN